MRVNFAKRQKSAAFAAAMIAGLFSVPLTLGSALAQDAAPQGAETGAPVVAYENPADSPLAKQGEAGAAIAPQSPTAMNQEPRQLPVAETSPETPQETPAQTPVETPAEPEAAKTSVEPGTATPAASSGEPAEQLQAEAPANAIVAGVRALLEGEAKNLDRLDARDREALKTFYVERQGEPLWVEAGGWNARAAAVKAEMGNAADWGLDPSAFTVPDLPAQAASEDLSAGELSFSKAVLLYARHARGGRIANPSKDLSSYLDRKPQLKPAGEVLTRIAVASDAGAYLRGLNPTHTQFMKLREELLALRKGAVEEEKVVAIPSDGPFLRVGSNHPHVALLRERLGVGMPEIAGNENPAEFFDEELENALKAFQGENGLGQDGVVGPRTRAAFNGGNVAISEEMLIANMEMWRWMPEDLGDVHVAANIPEFRFSVFKGGREIHSELIITGKTDKQTPVFSDVMETIVFHPFWGVPNSIKVNDLLPTLARGGDLSRNGLRLQKNGRDVDPRSIDWSRDDIRSYHVYQPPGRENVLGVVKFMFPNKHQVYMHDTPTKNLFNSKVRTYSHGCVRVRDPVKLAEVLMEADQGWPRSRVASLVNGGPQNNTIKLNSQIAVHTTYFTARVDENGDLLTFGDIYGHEKRVRLALAGKWDQINKGRDHLAPVQIDRSKIKFAPKTDPVQDFFSTVFGF